MTRLECCAVACGGIGSPGLKKVEVVAKGPQIRKRNKRTEDVDGSECIQCAGLFSEEVSRTQLHLNGFDPSVFVAADDSI